MDPRVKKGAKFIILSFLFFSCVSKPEGIDSSVTLETKALPYISTEGKASDEKYILDIRDLIIKEKYLEAIESLHDFRFQFPQSEYLSQAYYYSGLALYKLNQHFRAKYYLKQSIAQANNSIWEIKSGLLLGQIFYSDRLFEDAFVFLEKALQKLTHIGYDSIGKDNLDPIYLILAEIALNLKNDKQLAGRFFKNINPKILQSDFLIKYNLIQKKIKWNYLSKQLLGLQDGNISALGLDGDDIWVGTWNGGLARYTLSSGKSEVFTMGKTQLIDNAIRAIEITDNYVWVGTFYGISVYSKSSSKWKTINQINGTKPEIITVIKYVDRKFFVGTLGSGLFVYDPVRNSWEHYKQSNILYVLSLETFNHSLLIGTMTNGINIFNFHSKSITNYKLLNQQLPSKNITMLLHNENELWIGSYGDGLFNYNFNTKQLTIYSKLSGEIGDDWVLCGTQSDKGFYFGTFGGGASVFYPETNKWIQFDLSDGLNSFDIASIASSDNIIYFGTLGEGVSVLNE